ncbi:MAG: HAD family hydrolase [Lachnospiraceae bacterium]|nr:HAD family hydrolase [Lachnospiraceae bacterium]
MQKEYGILFDLDGTLWDSAEGVVDSWNERLAQLGEPERVTLEMIQKVMGMTMEQIAFVIFGEEDKDRALRLLKECTDHENEYLSAHGGVLYPKVEETLRKLHETYFLAVVSNCQLGYIEAFLSYHKLGEYFDDTESYGNTGKDKDVNIRLVTERNNLKKAVYVGDIMGDYKSTMKAGLPFLHAAYGFGEVPEGTPFVNEFCELPDAVKAVFDEQ